MNNVSDILKNNLCISCGVCTEICPKNCIEFNYDTAKVDVNETRCVDCGLCKKVCSLNVTKGYNHSNLIDFCLGKIKSVLCMKSEDKSILKNATSGGFITTTVKYLLDNNEYDSAFLLKDYTYKNILEPKRIVKGDGLSFTTKSRYVYVTHKQTCSYMVKNPDEKIIIVATPCAVYSIKKFIELKRLNPKNYLFLGLFCDKTMTTDVNRYFSQHPICKGRKLQSFYFRTKDKSGWPGDMRLFFDDDSYSDLPREERMQVKDFFMPEKCLYCLDKLNRYADISVGDNYVPDNKDIEGVNSVIIRTDLGEIILSKIKDLFEIKEDTKEGIIKSQHLDARENNLNNAKIKGLIKGKVKGKIKKRYKKSLKKIELGQSENVFEVVDAEINKKYKVINLFGIKIKKTIRPIKK